MEREREREREWVERERGEGTESPRHLTDTETQREADLVQLKQAEMSFLVGWQPQTATFRTAAQVNSCSASPLNLKQLFYLLPVLLWIHLDNTFSPVYWNQMVNNSESLPENTRIHRARCEQQELFSLTEVSDRKWRQVLACKMDTRWRQNTKTLITCVCFFHPKHTQIEVHSQGNDWLDWKPFIEKIYSKQET